MLLIPGLTVRCHLMGAVLIELILVGIILFIFFYFAL
jgi:hypothetical protein